MCKPGEPCPEDLPKGYDNVTDFASLLAAIKESAVKRPTITSGASKADIGVKLKVLTEANDPATLLRITEAVAMVGILTIGLGFDTLDELVAYVFPKYDALT